MKRGLQLAGYWALVLAAVAVATFLACNEARASGSHRSYAPVAARAAGLANPTPAPVPTSVLTPTPPPGGGGPTLDDIDGRATLVARDGTDLGLVSSDRFVSDSICNRFGAHGSRTGEASVRNRFGTYGGRFGDQSAYDPFAATPPAIVYQGRVVGFLTKNTTIDGGVDPDGLFAYYRCA